MGGFCVLMIRAAARDPDGHAHGHLVSSLSLINCHLSSHELLP